MTEEQKLTSPSFERFTAGFEVGSDAFALPAGGEVAADLSYETHVLHPPVDLRLATLVAVPTMQRAAMPMSELRTFAAMGAVARSDLARDRRLASRPRAGVAVTDAALAVVDATDLSPVADLAGDAVHSPAVAEQVVGTMSGELKLVEAFEVA
jgi:hypothetical protein